MENRDERIDYIEKPVRIEYVASENQKKLIETQILIQKIEENTHTHVELAKAIRNVFHIAQENHEMSMQLIHGFNLLSEQMCGTHNVVVTIYKEYSNRQDRRTWIKQFLDGMKDISGTILQIAGVCAIIWAIFQFAINNAG